MSGGMDMESIALMKLSVVSEGPAFCAARMIPSMI
jgi:hypothetical protein